jgi:hypothetical protein
MSGLWRHIFGRVTVLACRRLQQMRAASSRIEDGLFRSVATAPYLKPEMGYPKIQHTP